MRKYELVIFDMDGTILDSETPHNDMFGKFWDDYFPGYDGWSIMDKGKGNSIREILRMGGISPQMIEDVFDRLGEFYINDAGDYIKKLKFVDKTKETIEELKQGGVKVALITNSYHVLVDLVIKNNGMENAFDIVVGSTRDTVLKREHFEKILKEEDVAPQKALYVGDAEMDVVAAHSMGMDSLILFTPISWAKSPQALLEDYDPDFVIKDIRRVVDIVL